MKEEAIYVTKRLYKSEGKIHLEVEISNGNLCQKEMNKRLEKCKGKDDNDKYCINYVNEYYVIGVNEYYVIGETPGDTGDYSKFKIRAYTNDPIEKVFENILYELSQDININDVYEISVLNRTK